MINKLIFILFIFISLCFNGKAQGFTYKIDSIKVYHLPLSMNTFLALGDYEVRNWDEKIMNQEILKVHTITDSTDINLFTAVDILDTSNITAMQYSIDARIVIDIYLEKGLVLSIVMNSRGYYIMGNEKTLRSRNKKLNDWLRKYIHDLR